MATKVGINGFGRIGRQVLKAIVEGYPDTLEVVGINDITDAETNAHLFKYDSNYGRFEGSVEVKGDSLVVNGKTSRVLAERDPAKLPWKDLGAQIVLECTGIFSDREKASLHVKAGARSTAGGPWRLSLIEHAAWLNGEVRTRGEVADATTPLWRRRAGR